MCKLPRLAKKVCKCLETLVPSAIAFLRYVVTCAIYTLLYHSVRVKNTTITQTGLFLRDQVHSSHNVSPNNVQRS